MVKTRIAPSPTGDFHIGSMRTLLYNYALAKKSKGSFILRIEDTDRERLVEGAAERLQQVIKDYGLGWDEGPDVGGPNAPYIQSQRLHLYKKYAMELVEKGYAYRCFCTKERLDEVRKTQQDAHLPTTKYDRQCLGLTPLRVKKNLENGLPHVIRLKVPSDRIIFYDDLFLGRVSFPSNDVEDQILLKSDGFPTYHLAVVVDDHLMEITHILRGSEWLASTPKHVLLYEFLGWEMPKTGHLPGLKEVGANKKMSKRFGDVTALEFLKNGYLPEALLNFLMLLGWNPGTEREVFSLDEFVDEFSLERIHKTDLVAFDRDKLLWMNGYYIRQLSNEALYGKLVEWAKKWGVDLGAGEADRDYIIKALNLIKDRMKTLADFVSQSKYFFTDPQVEVKESGVLKSVGEVVGQTEPWTKEVLDKKLRDFIAEKNYNTKEVFGALRLAVTGEEATPPLADLLEVLGKDTVLRRIRAALSTNSI